MPLPSYAQSRIWYLSALNPESTAYNVGNIIRLRGELRPAKVRACIDRIFARHESLRSAFPNSEGVPELIYRNDVGCLFSEENFSDLGEDKYDLARERARLLARVPFDLTAGNLARWTLLKLAQDEHWLIYVVHHTVSDRWSLGVFVEELAHLLQDLPLKPLQGRYQEFADGQRMQMATESSATAIEYFTGMLGDAPYRLDLPTDHPRPARRSEQGRTLAFDLSHHLPALRQLAKDTRATPYQIAMTAFQVWLGQMTGNWRPIIATYIAERHQRAYQDLIGLFVNTVAFRFDLADDPQFKLAIQRTKTLWKASREHLGLPFEALVDGLNVERDPSRTPIAQVAFNFHNVSHDFREAGNVLLDILEIDCGGARFDLTLTLRMQPNSLVGEFEVDSNLFDALTTDRFAAAFDRMLTNLLGTPDQTVGQALLVDDAAYRSPVKGLPDPPNETNEDLLNRITIHARERPNQIALTFGSSNLSYQELVDTVDRTAAHLENCGVAEGQWVGICMERSAQMLIGILATLRLGATFVPLDPTLPLNRLAFIVRDAGLSAILCDDPLRPPFRSSVKWIAPAVSEHSPQLAPSIYTPSSTAYVMYTSGSTGTPKGVCIARSNLNALWRALDGRNLVPDHFRLLAATTISFDISMLELLWPLWRGAQVIVADQQTARDGALLAQAAAKAEVFQGTPSTLRMLIDSGYAPPPGQTILCGGEALPVPLADLLTAKGVRLFNMYGPTEATIWSSLWRVSTPCDRPSLGDPLPGEWFYIMNAQGRPVPPGAYGELWISGAGVASGYHNRPELTAERFVQDPFVVGARSYKTGDLVRQTADDRLLYAGRIDNQVKLRGHRIELGEIEACLDKIPEIDAVLVEMIGKEERARLVAFFSCKANADPPADSTLRSHVLSRLPVTMCPTQFVQVADFPLSASGKIQRGVLTPPEISSDPGQQPPANDLELRLERIWQQLLEVQEVGRADDFFSLGGNSLLAVKLVYLIHREFGVEISQAALLEAPTLEQLASSIASDGDWNRSSTVELKSGSAGSIWMLRGVHIYRSLAEALPDEIGCHAVYLEEEVDSLMSDTSEFLAMDERIAKYVEVLQERQPSGPIRLGGFSFGGVMAFEVARALAARGREVDLVALIDSHLPELRRVPGWSWITRQFHGIRARGVVGHVGEALHRRRWSVQQNGGLLDPHPPADVSALVSRRRSMYRAMLHGYRPSRYDGRTMLILSAESEALHGFPGQSASRWSEYCSNLESVTVESTHLQLMEPPYVNVIGQKLGAAISPSIAGIRPDRPSRQPG